MRRNDKVQYFNRAASRKVTFDTYIEGLLRTVRTAENALLLRTVCRPLCDDEKLIADEKTLSFVILRWP